MMLADPSQPPAPAIKGSILFHYYDDLDAAARWYQEILGLEVRMREDWLVLLRLAPSGWSMRSTAATSRRAAPGRMRCSRSRPTRSTPGMRGSRRSACARPMPRWCPDAAGGRANSPCAIPAIMWSNSSIGSRRPRSARALFAIENSEAPFAATNGAFFAFSLVRICSCHGFPSDAGSGSPQRRRQSRSRTTRYNIWRRTDFRHRRLRDSDQFRSPVAD